MEPFSVSFSGKFERHDGDVYVWGGERKVLFIYRGWKERNYFDLIYEF